MSYCFVVAGAIPAWGVRRTTDCGSFATDSFLDASVSYTFTETYLSHF